MQPEARAAPAEASTSRRARRPARGTKAATAKAGAEASGSSPVRRTKEEKKALRKALLAFIDGLAEMAADLHYAGKLEDEPPPLKAPPNDDDDY